MRVRGWVVFLVLVAIGLSVGIGVGYIADRGKPPTPEPLVPTLPPRTVLAPSQPGLRSALPAAPANAPVTPTPRPAPQASSLPDSPPVSTPAAFSPAPMNITPASTPGSARPPASPSGDAAWWPPASDRARVGVGAGPQGIDGFDWGDAPPGWYLNWWHLSRAMQWPQVAYVRMVHPTSGRVTPDPNEIKRTAAANPGALWLIGNEPDVVWQDNATPEQYAAAYGLLHSTIKGADPTAQIAIGGVSQPTPLRLAYLDRILTAYKAQFGAELPVDVWNIHAFILREERNSWGVGIPPGMNVDRGTLREIEDHADMEIFREQIVAFRRWMAERGQRNKPLIVTEYSILMPEDYGFPPEVVIQFMQDSFDYLLTARDDVLGYAADGYRLVQAFCWFSTADKVYQTSNLFDPETRAITPVGRAFKAYLARLE
jgi:hypothetical protein